MGTGSIYDQIFWKYGLSLMPMSIEIHGEGTLFDNPMPEIKNVIFSDPATIVFWDDGTKTIVKCQKQNGDVFSKETGLAMAIAKKVYGNKGNFNDVFAKWIKEKQ